jgi:hypothetical protein
MIILSAEQRIELIEALAEGFNPEALERRVMDPMQVPPHVRTAARDYRARIAALTEWAAAERRMADLLRTAYAANQYSERLRMLNEATGLVTATSGLVEAIRPALPKDGEKAWSRGLAEVSKQVCLVGNRRAGPAAGTGFLVGPDQVMTHLNVVAPDPAAAVDAIGRGEVMVSFDGDLQSRKTFRVVSAVHVSSGGVIVLRVDPPAGREIADFEAVGSARARGWIVPRALEQADRAVVIVQYVAGSRLKVLVDSDGLIGEYGPLIRYRTSTQLGSMGAPCFDASWRLIGMHIGSENGVNNQGIGIEAIVAQLRGQQLDWNVSSGVVAASTQVKLDKPSDTPGALDALVRDFKVAPGTHDPSDEVWSDDADDDASNPDRWAWAEAAAVTGSFDPEKLSPAGAPSPEARIAVLLDSSPLRRDGVTRWMLSERVRVRALERLAKRGELRTARAANTGDPADTLDAVLGAFITETAPTAADLQDPDRLRAMLQVAGWLARTGVKMPQAADLAALLERATLIAPFRHLTRGFFAGRDPERAALLAYVDGPDLGADAKAPPPILIQGPGGMGKSALLAHFILAHSERDTTKPDSWRPFVYLDFDRPELDARDLVGVLLAIARQIGSQMPDVHSEVAALQERWTDRRRAERPTPTLAPRSRQAQLSQHIGGGVDDLVAELAKILNRVHDVLPAPLVLVLDTLEEVQYATPDAVVPLAELVVTLRAAVPSLRPVLAGRVEIENVALTPILLGPLPQMAAESLLANHLPAVLAAKTDLVTRMVHVVGGNPLSLRLAAEVLKHETDARLDQLGEEELWQRVGDAIVQGQLYERILGHVHEGPIKKLAVPGLILRYLTWELIRDVLAGPLGIEIRDDAAAQSLFAELAKEIALVRQGDDAAKLVVRPELRRTILQNFRKDAGSTDRRRLVHEAAVTFFSRGVTQADRAEEIYHRLWLDQDPEAIDARWLTGIELALRSAVEELDGRGRTYLANRVGGADGATLAQTASPAEWEAYAEKRASDLLRLGAAAAALDVLQQRPDRLPTSRLYLIESVARRSLPNPELAQAETAASNAVAAARASADPGEIQGALEELVQVRRLRDDSAGVLRALADLGNLGDQLGDDLILLQAEVEGLESIQATGDSTQKFSEPAVRVFSRLPDELVAQAPELARRVAAQTGGDSPAVLQRVIGLVGVGPLNDKSAAGLGDVLTEWASRDEEVGSFIPKAPASAAELASATQYLLANRSPDQKTAAHISAWLQTVVTPGRDTELYRAIRSTASSQTFGMKALAERLKKLEQLRRFNASIRQGDTRLAEESNDLSSLERLEVGRPSEAIEQDFGLESIILRRQRPVLAIKHNEAQLDFVDKADSEIWAARLKQAKPFLDSAIRAVGRVELQGGMLDWVGTGWLVADDVMVTSRNVARMFAARNGQGFSFQMGHDGPIRASVDFLQEIDNANTAVFQLVRALHIEDEPGPDIAFFEIEVAGGNLKLAAPIQLATEIAVTENVAVIGYPAYDSRVPEPDLMDAIYGKIYNKKRLAPGGITSVEPTRILHNCTTLGGNWGSVVLDLDSGKAVGLHYAGAFLATNYAVRSDIMKKILDDVQFGRFRW